MTRPLRTLVGQKPAAANCRLSNHLSVTLRIVAALLAIVVLPGGSVAGSKTADSRVPKTHPAAAAPRSTDPVVAFIDQQIRQTWSDNGVVPSPAADDEEWFRRVHLDLVGHIPSWNSTDRFRKDKNPAKRAALVDALLDDPGYVRDWTTIWTNLTIGRQTPRRVNRQGMQKFFREAFATNRPWNEVVYDLVAAEGRNDQNGAVNYLLAQMTNNDEAVQATAKTTRLFLGEQVQCTQCHNHPFNDWKQDQFWQFNSFLRQTRRINHRKFDPATGRPGRRLHRVGSGEPIGSRSISRSATAKCRWPTRSFSKRRSIRVREPTAAKSWRG